MKIKAILTLIILIGVFGSTLHAQSSSAASPTMTLTVPQVATISVSNFTMGTSANPGNFASSLQGTVTLNYSVRVPQSGSPNAKITVQSAATTLTATGSASSTAPTVGSFQYSASASGTGVTATTSWQNLSGTTAGTLVSFAAGTKINAGTATANFKVADSLTYDADNYTLPLTFTISSQ
ncbi:MAG TPA: hypothetical protein VKY31_17270 [Terriglobia bacterium]|nr:hypothetical protein [Terriglobia bacterium]